MKEISHMTLFSLFLKSLGFDAKIDRAPNGLKARVGNSYFRLITSSGKIVLKQYGAKTNGGEYEKVEKLFVYTIVQEAGDIKILDENHRSVMRLREDHEVLKVESIEPQKQFNRIEYQGTEDLLKYREIASSKQASLF